MLDTKTTVKTTVKMTTMQQARLKHEQESEANVKQTFMRLKTSSGSQLIVDSDAGDDSDHKPDPTADNPTAPEYKHLDKVRKLLNDMYMETMAESDIILDDCQTTGDSLKLQIHTNTGTRVVTAQTIAQARGEIATANGEIDAATKLLVKLNTELDTLNYDCKVSLGKMNAQRVIVEGDLNVSQGVLHMLDCDAMAAKAGT